MLNINKYYVNRYGFQVIFAVAVMSCATSFFGTTYVPFLMSFGLTQFLANFVNVFFMVGNIFFEPFSGDLGDKIGQARVYILGMFFWTAATLLYWLSTAFPSFALSELFAAGGRSLMSDALESWSWNRMTEAEATKIMNRAKQVGEVASIPGTLLGGVIGDIAGLNWPWAISSLIAGLGVVIAAFFFSNTNGEKEEFVKAIEKKEQEQKEEEIHVLDIDPDATRWERVKKAYLLTFQSKELWPVVLMKGILTFSYQIVNMSWTVTLLAYGTDSSFNGLIALGVKFTVVIGSRLVENYVKIDKKILCLSIVSIAICLACMGYSREVFSYGFFFLLHEVPRASVDSMISVYYNKYLPNKYRLLYNSVKNSYVMICSALGLLVSGALTFLFSAQQVIAGLSVLIAIGAIYLYKALARNELSKEQELLEIG